MSRLEDRLAAPPALPPIRPPRGPHRWEDEPDFGKSPEPPPLWVKPSRSLGPIARVGVKFPSGPGDRRRFGAKSLSLTTCIVHKIIPPGARRSAALMAPTGYLRKSWAPLLGPKKLPKFRTRFERKRYSKRWLHGFTKQREYILRAPNCWTIARACDLMEKTQWSMTIRIVLKAEPEAE